jgi:Zn-finger nucleic acid-binding protein
MDCPICKVSLEMADRQGIEIDYCPKCRGIWLDRGELDKLIERSSQPYTPPQPNFPQGGRPFEQQDKYRGDHGYHEYDQYGRKKKKGLLGELFDF